MTDEEACARLYRDLCDASVRKDAAGIAAVLADDYVLVHMTGMRQPKRAYISAVLDGTLNYYSIEHDSIAGCIGCYRCIERGECVFSDDKVEDFLSMAGAYDGFEPPAPVEHRVSTNFIR